MMTRAYESLSRSFAAVVSKVQKVPLRADKPDVAGRIDLHGCCKWMQMDAQCIP
jgi:hypothetical protein